MALPDYLHGAYGDTNNAGTRESTDSQSAIVYVGTAPVHTLALGSGEGYNVNKPIIVNNMAEAMQYFGYSDDWAKYTLCEAMKVHLNDKGVGPLALINVLDPEKHVAATSTTESKTPSSGTITLSNGKLIVLDSIEVATKVKGTDYTAALNSDDNTVVLTEVTAGSLGSDALSVTYQRKTVNTTSLTPVNNAISIASAENIILESITIQTQDVTPVEKVKGTDYVASYNSAKKAITITGITDLGTDALTVSYQTINAALATSTDVIGSTDGMGLNTGLYCVRNVYPITGFVPAFLAAPGFSSIPAVHAAMYANSVKINGHWDAYMFVDLPLTNNDTVLNLETAVTWKNANGYTHQNETVYFPMVKGTDGMYYHLSTLAAANFQELLQEQDGVPYRTASNTDCSIIESLYTSANDVKRVYDDGIINEKLNKNGIASAAYVGGRWAIWGAHSADYSQSNADGVNVSETNRMMMYYVSNDFQVRRTFDVDKPMSANDLKTILAEEQARLDGLVQIGALIFGEAYVNMEAQSRSDIMKGDYSFSFNVTTTPIAKSLTVIVNWTDEGFVTYFEEIAA